MQKVTQRGEQNSTYLMARHILRLTQQGAAPSRRQSLIFTGCLIAVCDSAGPVPDGDRGAGSPACSRLITDSEL